MNQAQPFPWFGHGLILALLALGTALPYIVSAAALGVGQLAGCNLDPVLRDPCFVAGLDMGGLLRNAYGFGWLILATLPLGGGAFLCWLVVALIHRLAWSRMQNSERP